ncbi:MAG: O-methyltransferase-like protein [uncultured bacterium]|nr:MAG: O-methyltransferase-like protein [uncultured bacterium]
MDSYIQKARDILSQFGATCKTSVIPPIGQTKDELIFILDAVKKANPSIIVEIGTAQGGFIFMLSYILKDTNKTFISIDPWSKGTKYEKSFKIYQNTIKKLKSRFRSNRYLYIPEKSTSKNALNTLKKILNRKKIDSLFIDGDHSYETAAYDFNTYQNLVKKNGIIALHDIGGYEGVAKVWDKIKDKNEYIQIYEMIKKGKPLLKESEEKLLGVGYLLKK